MTNYDTEKLLDKCSKLTLTELLIFLNKEVQSVDTVYMKAKKNDPLLWKIKEYRKMSGELLFFLNTGTKPSALAKHEFALYRPIIQNLVNQNALKHEAMNLFD